MPSRTHGRPWPCEWVARSAGMERSGRSLEAAAYLPFSTAEGPQGSFGGRAPAKEPSQKQSAAGPRQSVQEKALWCTNRGKIGNSYRRSPSGVQTGWTTGQSRLSATAEAGRQCPPRTCATLGTIRGGTASAVVVERQRGFQGKPKQRSHRPEIAPQRDGGGR